MIPRMPISIIAHVADSETAATWDIVNVPPEGAEHPESG